MIFLTKYVFWHNVLKKMLQRTTLFKKVEFSRQNFEFECTNTYYDFRQLKCPCRSEDISVIVSVRICGNRCSRRWAGFWKVKPMIIYRDFTGLQPSTQTSSDRPIRTLTKTRILSFQDLTPDLKAHWGQIFWGN